LLGCLECREERVEVDPPPIPNSVCGQGLVPDHSPDGVFGDAEGIGRLLDGCELLGEFRLETASIARVFWQGLNWGG